MDSNLTVYYLQEKGHLRGFTDEETEEIVNLCNENFFFYDPYEDVFYNPILRKWYWSITIQSDFKREKNLLLKKLNCHTPTLIEFQKAKNRLGYWLGPNYKMYRLFRSFKWIGIVVGILIGYLLNYYLGFAIGFYLIYLDYNFYDSTNRLIENVQTGFICAIDWKKNKQQYYAKVIILLICSLVFIYLYSNSIIATVAFFIVHKWVFFNPIVKKSCSIMFRGHDLAIEFEKCYELEKKKDDFIKKHPNGLSIKDVEFEGEYICEIDETEELFLHYETIDNDSSVRVLLRSKKTINPEILKDYFNSDEFLKNLRRFIENSNIEFIFHRIKSDDPSSYVVITNNALFSKENLFEGDYNHNIVKEFDYDGQVQRKSEYTMGIQNGITEQFYDNGNLMYSFEYYMGVRNGFQKDYFENGTLEFQCEYLDGVLVEGQKIWYYDNGNIRMRGSIRHKKDDFALNSDMYLPDSDKRIGLWERFDLNGQLIKSVRYFPDKEKEVVFDITVNTDKTEESTWL